MAEEKVEEIIKTEEEETSVNKKFNALKDFMVADKVSGFEIFSVENNNMIFKSNLLVEGQQLPTFIVLNDSVYTYLQVYLTNITEDKKAKVLESLNEFNERYTMLKYLVNKEGSVILTCSIPSSDAKFDPAIIIALLDQVRQHVESTYADLMKLIWKE